MENGRSDVDTLVPFLVDNGKYLTVSLTLSINEYYRVRQVPVSRILYGE